MINVCTHVFNVLLVNGQTLNTERLIQNLEALVQGHDLTLLGADLILAVEATWDSCSADNEALQLKFFQQRKICRCPR